MKIFLDYIEDNKFKKDKTYEFMSENINYEKLKSNPKELVNDELEKMKIKL